MVYQATIITNTRPITLNIFFQNPQCKDRNPTNRSNNSWLYTNQLVHIQNNISRFQY